ncbi:hypothetical protein K435DRAFT_849115 [Dendrothele bispora CBS 962.96]|uniref:Uncharacterized protein n=1 Tax=Dendrothele bispora (strain CBS 962.96) TaxID=1314807 RepID=A0A4S8MT20_DENBC|nr:hypothetical protein K435DRAFT_849115 [Dendrothele bispora CBS 962.96]
MTNSSPKENGIKQESQEEIAVFQDMEKVQRNAFTIAGKKISNIIGPGQYLDSQTSETQYFGLSQTSGQVADREESQAQYGDADDDLFRPDSQFFDELDKRMELQSQLPEDDMDCTENSLFDSSGPPEIHDSEWTRDPTNQNQLDRLLMANFGNSTFLYDLIDKQEGLSDIHRHWNTVYQDETDRDPAQLALLDLTREAGISDQGFHRLNPVYQGHITVAGFLIRIANNLVRHGAGRQDLKSLENSLKDGRALLDIVDELVDIERDARRFIIEYRQD